MSKHKDLIQKMNSLETVETPYALATVFSVTGSSSGKVGDKALFDEQGQRITGYIGGGIRRQNRIDRLDDVGKVSSSHGFSLRYEIGGGLRSRDSLAANHMSVRQLNYANPERQ